MTDINPWVEYNPTELVPKFTANRFDDKRSNRFYYFLNENKERVPAAGITTWLSKVIPESSFLTDWKIKWGKDWLHVLNLTADYGTMLHACYGHIMITRTHPSKEMIDACKSLIKDLQRYDKSIGEDMIEKNLICFFRFMEDYNLKPLLIEAKLIVQACTGVYYALTQDLLAEADVPVKNKVMVEDGVYVKGDKKGQPKMKEVTEITHVKKVIAFDWKSNPFDKDKKSFFDSHLYQLIGTKKAVYQNFGIVVDEICNWSPNNWKTDVGDYTVHTWKPTTQDHELFELYERVATLKGAFSPSGTIKVYEDYKEGMKAVDMVKHFEYLEYLDYIDLLEKEE